MDWRFEKELEENRIKDAQKTIDLLENGEIKKFGLPDPLDYDAYFPCEFIETINYNKGSVKIYEPSIKQYHITEAWGLVIVD